MKYKIIALLVCSVTLQSAWIGFDNNYQSKEVLAQRLKQYKELKATHAQEKILEVKLAGPLQGEKTKEFYFNNFIGGAAIARQNGFAQVNTDAILQEAKNRVVILENFKKYQATRQSLNKVYPGNKFLELRPDGAYASLKKSPFAGGFTLDEVPKLSEIQDQNKAKAYLKVMEYESLQANYIDIENIATEVNQMKFDHCKDQTPIVIFPKDEHNNPVQIEKLNYEKYFIGEAIKYFSSEKNDLGKMMSLRGYSHSSQRISSLDCQSNKIIDFLKNAISCNAKKEEVERKVDILCPGNNLRQAYPQDGVHALNIHPCDPNFDQLLASNSSSSSSDEHKEKLVEYRNLVKNWSLIVELSDHKSYDPSQRQSYSLDDIDDIDTSKQNTFGTMRKSKSFSDIAGLDFESEKSQKLYRELVEIRREKLRKIEEQKALLQAEARKKIILEQQINEAKEDLEEQVDILYPANSLKKMFPHDAVQFVGVHPFDENFNSKVRKAALKFHTDKNKSGTNEAFHNYTENKNKIQKYVELVEANKRLIEVINKYDNALGKNNKRRASKYITTAGNQDTIDQEIGIINQFITNIEDEYQCLSYNNVD